jgi:hypothetical protein
MATMLSPWKLERALIVVRTYPTPARKGVEVSCTAAVTADQRWLRLFPIPYRFLTPDRQFSKYQWIDVRVQKSSDSRPESFEIDRDSIRIVSGVLPTTAGWRARKDAVLPLKSPSLCSLKAERDAKKHPTLGIFKPKAIHGLVFEKDRATWTDDELAKLSQGRMFEEAPKEELEKIPYKFKYRFTCDDPECPTHELHCSDWEMMQSYRRWRQRYGTDWVRYFRQRYETEMIHKNDTHFYVGTMASRPHVWIIVGLFYPPPDPQLALF